MVCVLNGVVFSHKEEWNHIACSKIDASEDHVLTEYPGSEKQDSHVFFLYMELGVGGMRVERNY